uniref:Putative ovule protein n=1 Tax=Solanum chacoense TaxID=4108 RepID=A0A0V0H7B6_SOLCH
MLKIPISLGNYLKISKMHPIFRQPHGLGNLHSKMFVAAYSLLLKIITLVFLVVSFSLVANGVSTSETAQYETHCH